MDENFDALLESEDFQSLAYQYTIMYIARIHSQAEFLFAKVLLLRGKLFSNYEASEIVEAFTIKTICDWEWYVEKILCECLKQETTQLSKHLALTLPITISTDECIAYLNGLGYFDLKSASNLKSIAKKILVDSKNPFKNINSQARNLIDDFYGLRNYVAHRSNKSKNTLVGVYTKYHQNDFIEVGEFLLMPSHQIDNIIRFQEFSSSFWLAALNIMELLCPSLYQWILGNEDSYNDNCHQRLVRLMEMAPNPPR